MGADVKQLRAWQCAVDLCERIYRETSSFPAAERFGLTAQLRRACLSVPSNLAEGYGRGTRREYRQFVRIARGSACEVETQIILGQRLGFFSETTAADLLEYVDQLRRMLTGLVRSLGDDPS